MYGTRRSIDVSLNNWISKYFSFNFSKFLRKLYGLTTVNVWNQMNNSCDMKQLDF